MSWLAGIRERIALRLLRSREDAEMDEEIHFHLEREAEANVGRGMDPAEARRRARVEFGGVERHREALRDGRAIPFVESVVADVRRGARALLRQPGAPALMIVILAVGMGSSVAIFSAVRQLVTSPLPYPEPERLFAIEPGQRYEDFLVWRREVADRADLVGFNQGSFLVGESGRTTYANGMVATQGFFDVIGIPPLLGRTTRADDHRPGAEPVVVLAEPLWRREFGGDPGILGRTILVQHRPHTVVGVVAADLGFPAYADLWTPVETAPDPSATYILPRGRAAPGVAPESLEAPIATIQSGLDADRPDGERGRRPSLIDFAGIWGGDTVMAINVFRLAVLFFLLVGVANAAGLLLARGVVRGREVALLSSLGASRARIARQFLAESGLIAVAAGALGVGFAYGFLRIIRAAIPESVSYQILGWERLGIDRGALVLAAALTLIVAIATALAPAIRAGRRDPAVDLRERSAAVVGAGKRSARTARVLLTGEVALALTLLLVAGLLSQGLVERTRRDPGYRTDDILTMRWTLPEGTSDPVAAAAVLDRIASAVRAIPGVASAGIGASIPTAPFGPRERYALADAAPDVEGVAADWRPILPGHLETLDVRTVAGRSVTASDDAGAPAVAIVDETLAARLAGEGVDAVGARIRAGGRVWTVVGVVENAIHPAASGPGRPTLYVPFAQLVDPVTAGYLTIRTVPGATGVAAAAAEAIWAVDPAIAAGRVAALADLVRDETYLDRMMVTVLVALGAVALLITVGSLYALVAHSVARRRREIGVMLALGATARRIVAGEMRRAMVAVAVGAGIGVLLAVGAGRALAAVFYGVDPADAVVFTAVPAALLAVALAACFLPARRAAGVDPMASLRTD